MDKSIAVSPRSFEATLSDGGSWNQTISINNIGRSVLNLTVEGHGIDQSWMSNYSDPDLSALKSGSTSYAYFILTVPKNVTPGDYGGRIDITRDCTVMETIDFDLRILSNDATKAG